MKLQKLLKLENVVEKLLREEELAREDDCYLILRVIQNMYPEFAGESFMNVMLGAKEKGISFESITRARRKVQRNYPELVNVQIESARQKEQLEYMEYANMNHIPGV